MNDSKREAIFQVENAHITYRNFRGEARQYNNAGNRNFNLILSEEDAKIFKDAGFRVRERSGRNDRKDDVIYLVQVNVSYKFRKPKIVVINGRTKTELDEEDIAELDYADVEYIDLTIRPYHWQMPDGRTGVKAYLNSMYVTLVSDPFEDKYFGKDEPFSVIEEVEELEELEDDPF